MVRPFEFVKRFTVLKISTMESEESEEDDGWTVLFYVFLRILLTICQGTHSVGLQQVDIHIIQQLQSHWPLSCLVMLPLTKSF